MNIHTENKYALVTSLVVYCSYFRWIEVIHVIRIDTVTNAGSSSFFNSLESKKEEKKVIIWII